MITIDSPSLIPQLPLPATTVSALETEIILPFGSRPSTAAFWEETNTRLLILQECDDVAALREEDPLLNFALTYPEWTIDLPNDFRLTMAITTDEGSGIYLLTPSISIEQIQD